MGIGRPRRRRLAALALTLGVLAVLAVVLFDSRAPKRASADTGVPPGDTTATVTRRTLSEGSTVDGTLGYGGKLELYDRLAGTYTWLPAAGAAIGRGGTLFRIDDLPVVLMYGSVPAYRVLKQGVGDGPDVAELNSNLIDLGYDPYGAIVDDEEFSAATAAAVRRWQHAAGLRETGEVELGRIVFAPDARRVTEVHVSLGQDPPGAPGTPPSESPGKGRELERHRAKHPKHNSAKRPTRHAPKRRSKPSAANKSPAKPAQESSSHAPASTSGPSKSGDSPSKRPSAEQGPSGGGGELALTTSSARQIVTLKVKAEQQQLARVGERVPVTLPGGDVVRGRITDVGTVASEAKAGGDEEKGGASGEGGEGATISVTVALEHAVAHLDEAPVSVELIRSVQHDVLVVPATALIATAGGGYAVEALAGARRVTVAVTPGMFASGYVEIEGAGVREGLRVIEAQ